MINLSSGLWLHLASLGCDCPVLFHSPLLPNRASAKTEPERAPNPSLSERQNPSLSERLSLFAESVEFSEFTESVEFSEFAESAEFSEFAAQAPYKPVVSPAQVPSHIFLAGWRANLASPSASSSSSRSTAG